MFKKLFLLLLFMNGLPFLTKIFNSIKAFIDFISTSNISSSLKNLELDSLVIIKNNITAILSSEFSSLETGPVLFTILFFLTIRAMRKKKKSMKKGGIKLSKKFSELAH